MEGTTPDGFVIADRLSDLKDGFWVNFSNEFTKVSDGERWIPAHKIEFIRIVNRT